MSEPKRYTLRMPDISYGMREGLYGEYVRYEDYARLKAEVERLKAEPDALTAYLYADTLRRDDIKTLKAHIERLTKAGDDLAQQYYQMNKRHPEHWSNAYAYWFEAKEGKQS